MSLRNSFLSSCGYLLMLYSTVRLSSVGFTNICKNSLKIVILSKESGSQQGGILVPYSMTVNNEHATIVNMTLLLLLLLMD